MISGCHSHLRNLFLIIDVSKSVGVNGIFVEVKDDVECRDSCAVVLFLIPKLMTGLP
jgi:hypothetical protein